MAADVLLDVPEKAQEHNQWCWAGASQSTLEYYKTTVTQCDIANWAFGRGDCCGNATFNWSHICNYWNNILGDSAYGKPGGSVHGIMTHWSIDANTIWNALSQASAVAEIDAEHPFILRFGWTGGGGHFLVGYGYDQAGLYLDYMDPWPGNGYTKSLYSWTVSASDHSWTHTLTTKGPPPPSPAGLRVVR
jgi:hypothetical protein